MNCKNCGAPITINQKFCPNCAAPNEMFAEHIKDMEHYDKEFKNTQNTVVGNSRWFVKYIAPITSLVIAIIVLAFFVITNNMNLAWDLAEANNNKYIKNNKTEIRNDMMDMLNKGDYYKVSLVYEKLNWDISGSDKYYYSTWEDFYNLTSSYARIRKYTLAYYDPYSENNYMLDNAISNIAGAICDADSVINPTHRRERAEESEKYIDMVQEEMNTFMKVYCNFTDADIVSLHGKDKTSVTALLTRRMFNEG